MAAITEFSFVITIPTKFGLLESNFADVNYVNIYFFNFLVFKIFYYVHFYLML